MKQLINHGVLGEAIKNMKRDLQEFFKLPLEEKMACAQTANNIEGYGQAFVISEEQKLDWGDLFFMVTQPVHARKPHLFPKLPLPFRSSLFLSVFVYCGFFKVLLFLN